MGGVINNGMISMVWLVRVEFAWLGDEGHVETFGCIKRYVRVQTALGRF